MQIVIAQLGRSCAARFVALLLTGVMSVGLAACDGNMFGFGNPLIGRWKLISAPQMDLSKFHLGPTIEFSEQSVIVGPIAYPVRYEVSGKTVVVFTNLPMGIAFRVDEANVATLELPFMGTMKYERVQPAGGGFSDLFGSK